jgi:hypothetical protein
LLYFDQRQIRLSRDPGDHLLLYLGVGAPLGTGLIGAALDLPSARAASGNLLRPSHTHSENIG